MSKTTCIVTRVRVNILHSSYFFLLQKKQQKRLSTIQLRELLSKHLSRSHCQAKVTYLTPDKHPGSRRLRLQNSAKK